MTSTLADHHQISHKNYPTPKTTNKLVKPLRCNKSFPASRLALYHCKHAYTSSLAFLIPPFNFRVGRMPRRTNNHGASDSSRIFTYLIDTERSSSSSVPIKRVCQQLFRAALPFWYPRVYTAVSGSVRAFYNSRLFLFQILLLDFSRGPEF